MNDCELSYYVPTSRMVQGGYGCSWTGARCVPCTQCDTRIASYYKEQATESLDDSDSADD